MKKWIAICLVGLTSAALAGCADSDTLGTAQLGEYKGVPVIVQSTDVTDEEVDSKIQTELDNNPNYVEVDRAAQEGDTVNIDYKGTQDGVEFAGGSGENQDLVLGSGDFIDGFEDGLIGAKKGDVKELDLTFPEDYNEESLAGQAVTFEVTVNAVKEKQDAVLDDAFVQRVSDFDTVEEYREDIRSQLKEQKERTAETQKEQSVLNTVVSEAEVKLNNNAVSARYNELIKEYESQAKMLGGSLSSMAQQYGTDEGGLKEMVMASVKSELREEVVVDTIAQQENLTVEDADRQAYAEENGSDVDTMVSIYGEDTFNQQVQRDKVMQFLADNAVEEEMPQESETAQETSEESSEAQETQETQETGSEEETEETTQEDTEE